MQKLYSKCLEEENIEKAIQVVYTHAGAKTAGADGISKSSNITKERIVKEVKLRLRRYKPVQSRTVQIPKGKGKAIGCLKEMGIKNFQLLRTIKHLMWTSKEY